MADTNKKNNFLDYDGLSLFWNNVKKVIEDNELVTATALTNLDTRVGQLEDTGSNQGTTSNQIIAISYADLKALRDTAKLVVTSRLHIASPCLAMGIPVILAKKHFGDRFGFIDCFLPTYTPEKYNDIDWSPSPINFEEEKHDNK